MSSGSSIHLAASAARRLARRNIIVANQNVYARQTAIVRHRFAGTLSTCGVGGPAAPPSSDPSFGAAAASFAHGKGRQNNRRDPSASLSAVAALALAGVIGGSAATSGRERGAECCGIAGVIGGKGQVDAREVLVEGLTILKNRGYDSAGLATISSVAEDPMFVTKYASNGDKADGIDLVREHSTLSSGHSVGIAHTRWATHGGKTDENAHPHLDSSGKIALVHNGTLNNANELRRELQNLGHKFQSQTDTEVIAKLIGHVRDEEKLSIRDATARALERCDGSWGLCIMCKDEPDQLVVACNGSPLLIGLGTNATFVASETTAFNRHTKNFIQMKDGEIGVIHADAQHTLDLSRVQKAPNQEVLLTPDPYPHWTLKECSEQPEAIGRALGFGSRISAEGIHLGGLDANCETLVKIKHMTLSACGTSLNAAKYAEKLMKELGSFETVHAIDAAETGPKDFPNTPDVQSSGLIVVSQSGETKDVIRVVDAAQDKGITALSCVNAVGSHIARMTKMGVYLNAGRENAVASTKAFTTQVTVLALVALWFKQQKNKLNGVTSNTEIKVLEDALMRLPISFGMALKCRDQCRDIAKRILTKEHCFVLGKGYAEPVAYEGALKLKECGYIHAEGFSGGALKHGPFALIESNETGNLGATPIILIILDDKHAHHMRTAAEEVKARGADVIVITDKRSLAEGLDENPIVIPNNGPLTALIATLPLQLLAYELALLRGVNPDTPRNLAKAVTVD